MRGKRMVETNAERSGAHQGATAADRIQARESGGGSTSGGYADRVSSCPNYCGYKVNGVVEFCSPGCREFGEWGRGA